MRPNVLTPFPPSTGRGPATQSVPSAVEHASSAMKARPNVHNDVGVSINSEKLDPERERVSENASVSTKRTESSLSISSGEGPSSLTSPTMLSVPSSVVAEKVRTHRTVASPAETSGYSTIDISSSNSTPVVVQDLGPLESEYSSSGGNLYGSGGGNFAALSREASISSLSGISGSTNKRQMEIMQQAGKNIQIYTFVYSSSSCLLFFA